MPSLLISPGFERRLIGTPLANCIARPKMVSLTMALAMPFAVDPRPGDDAAAEGVALVEDVGPQVAVEVVGVGAAGVALHRQRRW